MKHVNCYDHSIFSKGLLVNPLIVTEGCSKSSVYLGIEVDSDQSMRSYIICIPLVF